MQFPLADETSPRFIGVADIASVRFSLPAQLLEPTPNLGKSISDLLYTWRGGLLGGIANGFIEYWNYLDRPETFIRFVYCYPIHKIWLTNGLALEIPTMRLDVC